MKGIISKYGWETTQLTNPAGKLATVKHTKTSRRAFLFISNGGRFTRLNHVDLDSHFFFTKKIKEVVEKQKSLFIDPKQLALIEGPSKCNNSR